MEKRRYDRISIKGCYADLSDGVGFFSGEVADASRNGLLLQDVPKRFDHQTKKMTVVFSAAKRNFKIVAAPRWVENSGMSKTMGVEILNAPIGWAEFLAQSIPHQINDDVWQGVAIRN